MTPITSPQLVQPLLRNTLISFIICALLITGCYFWADPALAFWISHENLKQFLIFEYCTYIPNVLVWVSVLYYFYFAITFSNHFLELQQERKSTFRAPFLNVANSIAISLFIKDALKYIFGRYWPNTCSNNNLSLLHDHAYGFHFFHSGVAYQSFPSGNTTVAVAAMTAVWIAYPRPALRCLAILVAVAVVIGLLGENYHFLGDCIAGGWLGATVAIYVATYAKMKKLFWQ